MRLLPVPTTAVEIAELLREAIVHGYVRGALVVGRRRPFVPFGTDPQPINAECARRYAVVIDPLGTAAIREVDLADVRPFELEVPA